MDGGIARSRLFVEHISWRKDHPHGFVARPKTGFDGAVNLMVWHCFIPGKPTFFLLIFVSNSDMIYLTDMVDWEGGFYPITMQFREIYPYKPPKCKFPQGFFHPNVYPSGKVYLPSILNDDIGWSPAITVKQFLVGIQYLLDQSNLNNPAQIE
ncbi:hypothetical protein H5410_036952, partial [Solanum commersonii]